MEAAKPNVQYLLAGVMNYNQIKELILQNLVKMLIARSIIDKNNINQYVSSAFAAIDQNDETSIKLTEDEGNKMGSEKIIIKFISRKLTTIRKVIDIEDFMDRPEYKFVIVTNLAPKAEKQITEYKNTELFYGTELQINLIDHILIPKHIKLSSNEVEELVAAYQFDKKNAKRMFINDPVARYYKAVIGDVFRIERPSIASGIICDYRVVHAGSIYK